MFWFTFLTTLAKVLGYSLGISAGIISTIVGLGIFVLFFELLRKDKK